MMKTWMGVGDDGWPSPVLLCKMRAKRARGEEELGEGFLSSPKQERRPSTRPQAGVRGEATLIGI